MKKLIIILIAALMLPLASCENQPQKEPASDTPAVTTAAVTTEAPNTTIIGSDNMRDKLYQIKKDWTLEQIIDFMGEPDDVASGGIFYMPVYFLSDTEIARIVTYNLGFTPEITIVNTETGEKTTVLRSNLRDHGTEN